MDMDGLPVYLWIKSSINHLSMGDLHPFAVAVSNNQSIKIIQVNALRLLWKLCKIYRYAACSCPPFSEPWRWHLAHGGHGAWGSTFWGWLTFTGNFTAFVEIPTSIAQFSFACIHLCQQRILAWKESPLLCSHHWTCDMCVIPAIKHG